VGGRWTHEFCDEHVPGSKSKRWLKEKIDLAADVHTHIYHRLCSMNATRNLLQHGTERGIFFLEEWRQKQYLDDFTYVLDYACPNHQLVHTNPEAEELRQALKTTMEQEAVFQARIQHLSTESNLLNWYKAQAAFYKAENASLGGAKSPSAEENTDGHDNGSAKRQAIDSARIPTARHYHLEWSSTYKNIIFSTQNHIRCFSFFVCDSVFRRRCDAGPHILAARQQLQHTQIRPYGRKNRRRLPQRRGDTHSVSHDRRSVGIGRQEGARTSGRTSGRSRHRAVRRLAVRSYDPASLTEAEIDLLYQETPVDHPLFGGISQAWGMKELADGADSDDDYRRLF
jgi:hypothetical protein